MRRLFGAVVALIALAWVDAAWAVTGTVTSTTVPNFTITITSKTSTSKVVRRVHLKTRTGKVTTDIPGTARKVDITIYTDGGIPVLTLVDIDVGLLTGPGGYTVDIPGGGGPGQTATMPLWPGMMSFELYGMCNHTKFGITELSELSGMVTFKSDQSGTGCGLGGAAVFNGLLGDGVVSPFASFGWLGQDVRNTFATGSFIGEQVKGVATIGAQIGLVSWDRGTYEIYGTGGLAVVEKEFTISFVGTGVSTRDDWQLGGMLGIGFAVAPRGLQLDNHQIKLFVEYEHIWVTDADWNTPGVSPAFNYRFSNDMDMVMFGLSMALSPGENGRRALINR
jgi:hypothetical protein